MGMQSLECYLRRMVCGWLFVRVIRGEVASFVQNSPSLDNI
jgi:hypothetical protein